MNWTEFFTNLMTHYGYLILLIWTFFEGETALVLAGVLSFTGHMELGLSIFIAGTGGMLGDLFWFYIGKKHFDIVKDKIKNNEIIVDEIKKILKKFDILVIFIQRYLYGLRTIIPIVIGMTKFDTKRFFIINYISALFWSASIMIPAYYFGNNILNIFEKIKSYWYIFVILYIFFFIFFGKKIKKRLIEFELKKIDEINKK